MKTHGYEAEGTLIDDHVVVKQLSGLIEVHGKWEFDECIKQTNQEVITRKWPRYQATWMISTLFPCTPNL